MRKWALWMQLALCAYLAAGCANGDGARSGLVGEWFPASVVDTDDKTVSVDAYLRRAPDDDVLRCTLNSRS